MRKGIFGLNNIMVAILATLILLLIAILLFNMVNPASESSLGFGQQAASVFD